jgi:catechol 2,3-dioxygenase-like lactoylglutathione lyase family enzyme
MYAWLTCVLIAVFTQGQSAPPQADAPFSATRGAFFALSVADINASATWYTEKLGLTVTLRQPKQEKAAVVVLEGGGLTVELVQHDDAVKASKDVPLTHGIFKVGLVVDDLDKTVASLKARGVPIFLGPFPARGKAKSNAIIKDNAGNLIQFFGT